MPTKQELAEEAKVAQLKQLATDNEVDLEGATKKDDIVEKIVASRKVTKEDLDRVVNADDSPEGEGDGDGDGDSEDFQHDASPTGAANLAGIGQSQLDTAPPMKEEHGTNIPAPNLRQPVIEEALPTGSSAPQALDPMLMDPDKAAAERVEGRTSDAKNREAGVQIDEVPPDIGANEKPSDGGVDRYPFPPQGDVEVATVEPGNSTDEYMLPLEVEDWVVLDGSHELVPERLDGRRAVVLDAPRYLIPMDKSADVWIQVRTRDEVNATLHIPLAAVKEVQKGGISPAVRG